MMKNATTKQIHFVSSRSRPLRPVAFVVGCLIVINTLQWWLFGQFSQLSFLLSALGILGWLSYILLKGFQLTIVIDESRILFGYSKDDMQIIVKQSIDRIEQLGNSLTPYFYVTTHDDLTYKIPLQGFNKQQKLAILNCLKTYKSHVS